jgi:hypothetical protein
MPGGDDMFGSCVIGNGCQDCGGPVSGRDAGGHAVPGFNRNREVGAKARFVSLGHHLQFQLVT